MGVIHMTKPMLNQLETLIRWNDQCGDHLGNKAHWDTRNMALMEWIRQAREGDMR